MLKRLIVAGLIGMAIWNLGSGVYMSAKAILAQWLLQEAWHKSQRMGGHYKPWPWADTWPLARLHFASRDQHLIVLNGASGRNLAFAPAHLSASVKPGESGVSVIGGHRDTHFAFLEQVQIGESFELERADGLRQSFRVSEIHIADIRQSQIALEADRPVLALVACYPFLTLERDSPLRYLVIAEAEEVLDRSAIDIHKFYL